MDTNIIKFWTDGKCARCGVQIDENYGWVDIYGKRYRICTKCKQEWRKLSKRELMTFVRKKDVRVCTKCGKIMFDIEERQNFGEACLCESYTNDYYKHIDSFKIDFLHNQYMNL